jgi:O-antigen/teichoic acid export membrane protein
MSRRVRLIWAASLGWAYQLLALFVGLWMTKYLVGRLGDATMGWWTHALVMIGYITVVDFGLSAFMPRDIAKESGLSGGWQNSKNLSCILARWAKFAVIQLPFAAIVAVIAIVVMSKNDESNTMAAVAVMGIALFAYPFRIGGLLVNGLQDFRYEGLVQLLSYLSNIGVAFCLSRWYSGPLVVIGGWATQMLVSYSLMWVRILVVYRSVLPTTSDLLKAATPRSMFDTGAFAWLSTVGVTLSATSEILVLGWFVKEGDLFNYSCTTKLVVILTPLALTLGAAMLPVLSEMRSSASPESLEKTVVIYTEFILAISGLFGCLVLSANENFVCWWLDGSRFVGAFVTLSAVTAMHFRHLLNGIAIVMVALDLERPLCKLNFISGSISVVVTFAFVAFGGITWAAVGPALTLASSCVVAMWITARKAPQLVHHLAMRIAVWSLFYLPSLLICYGLLRMFARPELTSLATVGILSIATYGCFMLIPGLRSHAWLMIWSRSPLLKTLYAAKEA